MSKTDIDEEPCFGGCGKPGEDEMHACPTEAARGDRNPEYCNCCRSCHNDCEAEARFLKKPRLKH